MDKRIESSLGVNDYWLSQGYKPEYAGGILWQSGPPTSWIMETDKVPLFIPSVYDYTGFFVNHNMPCACLPDNPAVYNCNLGVFEPSRKAQSEGWRLVKNDTKFKAFAYDLIYKGGLKSLLTTAALTLVLGVFIVIGVVGLCLS